MPVDLAHHRGLPQQLSNTDNRHCNARWYQSGIGQFQCMYPWQQPPANSQYHACLLIWSDQFGVPNGIASLREKLKRTPCTITSDQSADHTTLSWIGSFHAQELKQNMPHNLVILGTGFISKLSYSVHILWIHTQSRKWNCTVGQG